MNDDWNKDWSELSAKSKTTYLRIGIIVVIGFILIYVAGLMSLKYLLLAVLVIGGTMVLKYGYPRLSKWKKNRKLKR